ncbi:MAG TPA: hypothetical protein DDZ80_25975 [Cyanobacteria bacterium UBA8803]|nr:hypothetical protein [Cyanobacteria bacterium UBA9273]HBL61739.1 hypothetical protein [Cyanobacteria bacterium UBA8803]
MNISSFSKLVGAGVIAATLAVVPFSTQVQAQDTAPGTGTYTAPNTNTDAGYTEDDDMDWGWLGLLGLAGLAGLAGRKRNEPARYADPDPDVRVRAGSDYR